MSQYFSLNMMDLTNLSTWYLYSFNNLILYSEMFIAINMLFILMFKFSLKSWLLPLTDWMMLEVVWTIFPMFILVILGLPSLKILYFSETFNFSSKFSLKIMGHQWFWDYSYLELMFSMMSYPKIMSDYVRLGDCGLLCVPFNLKIRVLITSEDVIHSWSLPSFGFKMDACPGRLNFFMLLFLSPSKNYGQCSELCGNYHSWMPIYIEVTSLSLFIEWLKTQS